MHSRAELYLLVLTNVVAKKGLDLQNILLMN